MITITKNSFDKELIDQFQEFGLLNGKRNAISEESFDKIAYKHAKMIDNMIDLSEETVDVLSKYKHMHKLRYDYNKKVI